MLVLSRKKNESIIIDQEIRITIVEIRGDKVRLGIEAPKEVPVHRSEIHEAIRSERAAEERDRAGAGLPSQPANPDLT
jgi:carbon storage regulator